MRRRQFIGLVGGAALLPFAGRAQNGAPKRIAFFPDFFPSILEGWRADMRAYGWIEGRDYVVILSGIDQGSRSAGSRGPLDEAAQRLVANKPDLVCTLSTAYALAMQRATQSVPIVMITSGYPVEAGVADSLARPGRNVTGNAIYAEMRVWGKILQLLREAKPDIKRVGIFWTYVPPAFPKEEIEPGYIELRSAADSLGMEIRILEVASPGDVPAALAEIGQWNPEGLLLTSLFPKGMSTVMQFAAEKHLPTIADFDWTSQAPPHPLLCYGPNYRELVQSAVASIDKILRGSTPNDLPIQRPRRFELIISLKTASATGLNLPPTLLAQADRVID